MVTNILFLPFRYGAHHPGRAAYFNTTEWTLDVKPHTQSSLQMTAIAMAAEMVSGRLNAIAGRFAFPVVVHVGEQVMVLRSMEHFLEALSAYRSLLMSQWLSLIVPKISDLEIDTDGQSRLSVRNQYYTTDGRELGTSQITYYLEVTNAGQKIRMVDFKEWPCPDLVAEYEPLQKLFR